MEVWTLSQVHISFTDFGGDLGAGGLTRCSSSFKGARVSQVCRKIYYDAFALGLVRSERHEVGRERFAGSSKGLRIPPERREEPGEEALVSAAVCPEEHGDVNPPVFPRLVVNHAHVLVKLVKPALNGPFRAVDANFPPFP